jgi:hypothetical protein
MEDLWATGSVSVVRRRLPSAVAYPPPKFVSMNYKGVISVLYDIYAAIYMQQYICSSMYERLTLQSRSIRSCRMGLLHEAGGAGAHFNYTSGVKAWAAVRCGRFGLFQGVIFFSEAYSTVPSEEIKDMTVAGTDRVLAVPVH